MYFINVVLPFGRNKDNNCVKIMLKHIHNENALKQESLADDLAIGDAHRLFSAGRGSI